MVEENESEVEPEATPEAPDTGSLKVWYRGRMRNSSSCSLEV